MDLARMLRYCSLLEQHNDRSWFHEKSNHELYEAARRDFIGLVDELKYRIADAVSPDLAERLIFADAKSLLYRIPRDMRVNKHKPPYNPRWSAYLAADRHSVLPIGYYVHLQPGDRSHFGTGAWCEDREMLWQVRSYISLHFARFSEALSHSGCMLWGERLKRVPADFDPDDPAAEYLKYKDWLVSRSFDDRELTDADAFIDAVVETVERMEPLRLFFNDALSGRRRDPLDESDW